MLLVQICIYLLFVSSYAFNIDTNYPVVYEDPFKSLNLSKSSYFGYSLVLYPGNNAKTPWILIGAPRGVNNQNVSTGVCFKCGIAEKCERIDINALSVSSHSDYKENVRNAWVGASMDINYKTKRVATCAPRWIKEKTLKKDKDYRMQGACYWFHTDDTEVQKLLPLTTENLDLYNVPGGDNVYYYSQGQSGFSLHLPTKGQRMVLGAPGVYNWDGTLILYKDGVDSSPIASRSRTTDYYNKGRSRDVKPNEFGVKHIANAIKTKYMYAFDLLGYSTTSGCFYNKSNLFYASSAPRSNYQGQVLIYTFAKRSNTALMIRELKHGRQFGEYFGASLTAGDINNDGLDDLIVGAPFFKSKVYNEGKIYIFMGSLSGQLQEPAFIFGRITNGQFGTTVQYLGDINHDHIGDVAVAAPYEDENSGVLYLYQGTFKGLKPEYTQRIVGKEVYQGIRGFGMSISRAVDIDSNKYPDIAVGAYLSGHVVLLRTSPVITTYQELTFFPSHLKPKASSFRIQECFSYKLDNEDLNNISISRTLQIDQQLGRAFLNSNPEDVIKLKPNAPTCRNITVRLTNSSSNRYNPIVVTLSHKLIEKQQTKQIVYVDDQKHGEDMFCPRCAVYDKFRSKSSETSQIPFVLKCKSNVCQANLKVTLKIMGLKDNTFVLGSKNDLKLQINLKNSGEKAYLTQVLVTLPEVVIFGSTPSQCTEKNSSSVLCSVDNPLGTNKEKLVMLDLDMTNINTGKYEDALIFTVEAMTTSKNKGDKIKNLIVKLKREADVTITGKSEEQSYSYRNITDGKLNFTQVYQVEKFGSSPLNSIMIEINIPHLIQMSDGSVITFAGLYLPVGSLGNQDAICRSNFTYLEERRTDNIDTEDNGLKMRLTKRSVVDVEVFNKSKVDKATTTKENEVDDFQNRRFYLNCSMNQVVCSKVICTAGPLKSRQIVKIKLPMLVNIAAIKDLLGKKDVILFATQGRVIVTNPANFVQSGDKPDSVDVGSLFVGNSQPEIVALWIIIVSVVAGLLLLILLTVGLVKLGFFKRTAKEELEQLKKEVVYKHQDFAKDRVVNK